MVTSLEEAQLEERTLRGGWRLLCIATLRDAVAQLEEESALFARRREKWRHTQPSYAEQWLGGGVGTVTFEDCCEVMGVTPEVARQKIEDYALDAGRRSLRKPAYPYRRPL